MKTTDCQLGVVRLIPSLILLERLLQLVHFVLILLSIWIRYTLDKLTIVLSIALVEIVSECVWYNWCNLYLFIECLEELCTSWQSSGVSERSVQYSIYLEVFLELYLICIIYYKFWRPESGWCSYSFRINPGSLIFTELWANT